MITNRQPLHVFEDTIFRGQIFDKSHIMIDKLIAGIIKGSLPNQRESLTGCPPADNIHRAISYPGPLSDELTRELTNICADGR